MEWWQWLLIGIGAIIIGAIKITVFKRMKQNATKKKFTDEE